MRWSVALLLLVAVLALAPAQAPLHLSYVYSDSMAPTIQQGDGYLVWGPGDVAVGDVVTYRSAERGSYVTHRVVGRTDGGFVTRGDANDRTDQATGSPPVPRSAIVGTVVTVGGSPLTVPHLGTAVRLLRAHALGVALLALGGLALSGRGGAGDRERTVTRLSDVVAPALALAAVTIALVLAYGGAAHAETLVATAEGSSDPSVVRVGDPQNLSYAVSVADVPFTRRVVGASGFAVRQVDRNASGLAVTGRLPPPASRGPVDVSLRVSRYPAVLPRPTLAALHDRHPLLAGGVTAGLVVGSLAAAFALFADPRTPIRPPRSRWRRLLDGGAR
ncbi:MAG: signal peptidase I [Halobacteriaceae archaeon]